ncbi:MAG: CAP domain-containing protein [Myxococcota bacterium]|nr:CAP domain-containing protein [Myxococcota bacterium]
MGRIFHFRCIFYVALVLYTGCSELFDSSDDNGDPGSYDCDAGSGEDWPSDLAAAECRVFELVNEYRAQGADCGGAGVFGPADPLALQADLIDAARWHSEDMGERNYFSHDSPGGPNGDTMQDRIESAGYVNWLTIGENIAAGNASADGTMIDWMASPGHCANIMNPDFTQIGIGYARVSGSTYTHYWTQDFGTPR